MQYKTILYIINYFVFLHKIYFINATPIIGMNVMRPDDAGLNSIVCILRIDPEVNRMEENVWCAGTLVTNQHVITAEHCFDNLNFLPLEVSVGSIELGAGDMSRPLWWLTHDLWANANDVPIMFNSNDIAVMKLIEPVNLRRRSIITPTLSSTPYIQLCDLGINAIIAGWGISTNGDHPLVLEMGYLKIITHQRCNNLVQSITGVVHNVPETLFCTVANPYMLLAAGDGGGPLLYGNILIGVNLGNIPNDNNFHPGKPNLHIDVSQYRYFIDAGLHY